MYFAFLKQDCLKANKHKYQMEAGCGFKTGSLVQTDVDLLALGVPALTPVSCG